MTKRGLQLKWPSSTRGHKIGVCVSGGLDSAVLLAKAAKAYREVHPIFIINGHPWEKTEFNSLKRFLSALKSRTMRPPVSLAFPIRQLLDQTWGKNEYHPGFYEGYSASFIPGRNLGLLALAALYAFAERINVMAMGTIKNNPYPDAQPAFFRSFEAMVKKGMGFKLNIITPMAHLNKTEVTRLGQDLPLELTFSCVAPAKGRHCGNNCNKCAERQKAFALAGIADKTDYAHAPPAMDWRVHRWPD